MDVKYFIQKKHTPIILSLIIILHIFILLQTVFWPASEFRILPYLTAKGLVPYKDIIDQHFPGIFFFPINLFTIGLANPLGLRLLQIIIIILTHIAIHLTTRKLGGSKTSSIFANILYVFAQTLFEGYVLWIDSFIAPLVLVSYLLLISETKGTGFRLTFLSGIFLSLALLFKQLIVLVFGFVIIVLLLFRVSKKRIFMFAFGFVLPVIFMLIYFSNRHLINDFLYWTITFNSKVYPKYAFRPPLLKEILLILIVVAPFIIFTVQEYIKREKRRNILLLSAYALPLLIFIYGRYDFVHLQPFLPFACIFISVGMFTTKPRFHYALGYLLILILTCTLHISKLGKYTTFIENTHELSIREINKLNNEGFTIYLDSHHELYQITGTTPYNYKYVPKLPWYLDKEKKIFSESFSTKRPDVVMVLNNTDKSSEIYKFAETHYTKVKSVDDFYIFSSEDKESGVENASSVVQLTKREEIKD